VTGDVSGDGEINAVDSNYMKRAIAGVLPLSEKQTAAADTDGNKAINGKDSNTLKRMISGSN